MIGSTMQPNCCSEKLEFLFKIKAEQVLRLNENKDFSYAEAEGDFGFSPLAFEEGIALECSSLLLHQSA